jgi:hypothetical protein
MLLTWEFVSLLHADASTGQELWKLLQAFATSQWATDLRRLEPGEVSKNVGTQALLLSAAPV